MNNLIDLNKKRSEWVDDKIEENEQSIQDALAEMAEAVLEYLENLDEETTTFLAREVAKRKGDRILSQFLFEVIDSRG